MMLDAGDVAWVDLNPIRGTEQAGRRPALVLTSRAYYERSPRTLVCPITSRVREWPFNVLLPAGLKVEGVVLVDQIRMVDRTQRIFDVIDVVPLETLAEVRGRLVSLIGVDLAGWVSVSST